MIKKLFLAGLITLVSSCIFAADELAYFEFILQGGSNPVTAGDYIALTITAYDTEGDQMTDSGGNSYHGHVTLTVSVGETSIDETGTNVTEDFNENGRWTGVMPLLGAAPSVTITCQDVSGATGTAYKPVNAGAYNPDGGEGQLLVLVENMERVPGTTGSGYTGYPVTQTIDVPLKVTVFACDDYYNIASSIPGPSNIEITLGVAETVEPSQINIADAAGNTSFTLINHNNQSGITGYTLIASDLNSSGSDSVVIPFASLDDYFIWAEAPASITAGDPMKVTVTVSHFYGGSPISGYSETVSIKAIENSAERADAAPGLTPDANPQMQTTDGVAVFSGVSYLRSSSDPATGDIRIRPDCLTDVMTNGDNDNRDSNIIYVYAAEPVSFTVSAGEERLSKGEETAVSAEVFDVYANPVSETAVNFAIMEGGGALNTTTAATNFSGGASVIFTAPADNMRNIISAEVPGITGYKYVTITSVLTTQFTNWPNPFNPCREETKIHYYLEEDSAVQLKIFSVFGRLVWSKDIKKGEVKNGEKHGCAGGNTVTWNGKAGGGYTVGAGLYVLKMKIGDNSYTRKIAVVK